MNIETPLKNMSVKVFGPSLFWTNSATLVLFRKLGGRVITSNKHVGSATHLVTLKEPIAPFEPNNGTMTSQDFTDYVEQRSQLERRPQGVKVLSMESFKDLVDEAFLARENAVRLERQGRAASLFADPLVRETAYVGI